MNGPVSSPSDALSRAVDEAAHHLPAQGPIGQFVHHNTLHALQHLPFEEAVVVARGIHGAEPFMPLGWYRARRDEGRIGDDDVSAVLERQDDSDGVVAAGLTRCELRRALMEIDAEELDEPLVRYLLAESDELADPSSSACWSQARRLVDEQELGAASDDRDGPSADSDLAVDAAMGRLAGMFLDQGLAYWPMPDRGRGFHAATCSLWSLAGHVDPPGLEGAGAAFRAQERSGERAEAVVVRHLEARGCAPSEWPHRLECTLLKTPGWAGLFRVFELAPESAPRAAPPCSLVDFLAVRLTLEAVAARHRRDDPAPSAPRRPLVATWELFELAKLLGWSAARLSAMDAAERRGLADELRAFDGVARRSAWHQAYERRHRRGVLAAIATHRERFDPNRPRPPAKAQVFFCIDDREESLRRHLEELDPGWETLGAAGFFGVAIEYKGHDDAHGRALCPVAVRPDLAVAERAIEHDRDKSARRAARRRLAATLGRGAWVASRGLVRGWLVTAGLGLLSALPLSASVLFPGVVARLRHRLAEALLPAPRTELAVRRCEDEEGMTVAEKVDRVAAILTTAGLAHGFAPIVMMLGHGSSSLNNPHEAAHDCGACAGGRGRPNARLFAAIANERAVRQGLREERGIDIPDGTWFVGGYHDTCNDAVIYDDLAAVPEARRARLDELIAALDEARARNAHERCRFFEWSPRDRSPARALAHVEARSEHLAEPRPEYGHSTNALCIVGRRALTRGLFLDRRAFLVSYDPTQDDDGGVLGALLASVGPVGAGINLEYYFSFVDNERYGCGTKLPHNVTGLVGVVNGHASDLRTGLPWQMVETHEPVRMLTIVESTPDVLLAIAERFPAVGELVVNRWIQLASVDPTTGAIHVFEDGRFVPFDERAPLGEAELSADVYRGRTTALPIAAIRSALPLEVARP